MGEHTAPDKKLYGLIAEFDTGEAVREAAERAYKAGYRCMDAYSPFPVHGLAEALGFRKCAVAPITLTGALLGTLTAFAMQYIAAVLHYPYDIGGKPFFSWPSFVPVMFELTILFGGFSAFFGMFYLNGLPQPYHPVFNAKRFERASSDGFFLCIEETDPQFDIEKTRTFLESLKPVEVSEVYE